MKNLAVLESHFPVKINKILDFENLPNRIIITASEARVALTIQKSIQFGRFNVAALRPLKAAILHVVSRQRLKDISHSFLHCLSENIITLIMCGVNFFCLYHPPFSQEPKAH